MPGTFTLFYGSPFRACRFLPCRILAHRRFLCTSRWVRIRSVLARHGTYRFPGCSLAYYSADLTVQVIDTCAIRAPPCCHRPALESWNRGYRERCLMGCHRRVLLPERSRSALVRTAAEHTSWIEHANTSRDEHYSLGTRLRLRSARLEGLERAWSQANYALNDKSRMMGEPPFLEQTRTLWAFSGHVAQPSAWKVNVWAPRYHEHFDGRPLEFRRSPPRFRRNSFMTSSVTEHGRRCASLFPKTHWNITRMREFLQRRALPPPRWNVACWVRYRACVILMR